MKQKILLILLMSLMTLTGAFAQEETLENVTASAGYETCGRGQKDAVLFCIKLWGTAEEPLKLGYINLSFTGDSYKQVGHLRVYLSDTPEFYALAHPIALFDAKPSAQHNINFHDRSFTDGRPHYLWVTTDIKGKAPLGSTLEARLTDVSYTLGDTSAILQPHATSHMKVYKAWHCLFAPMSHGSRYYRIPALAVARDGSIVALADKRNENDADLGQHDIDVVCRRSTDGGRTWSLQQVIADGDGRSEARYGFGDPSLTVAPNGDLVSLVAAGHNSFWSGMTHMFKIVSHDNGRTWQTPVSVFDDHFTDRISGQQNKFGEYSIFCTSGKGLTTREGRMMLLANVMKKRGRIDNFLLYSDDNGQSWTLDSTTVYRGGDEAKLQQLSDGTILASIRQNGARGFNTADASGLQWNGSWRSQTLSMTACNADLLRYDDHLLLHTVLADDGRYDLRIYASIDEGRTWHEVDAVQPGEAAYSTMAKLPNGDVAVFFEDASYDGGNDYALNYIVIDKKTVKQWGKAAITAD